jgi:hypothetical protein
MTNCRRDARPGTPESTVKTDKLIKFESDSGILLNGLL